MSGMIVSMIQSGWRVQVLLAVTGRSAQMMGSVRGGANNVKVDCVNRGCCLLKAARTNQSPLLPPQEEAATCRAMRDNLWLR